MTFYVNKLCVLFVCFYYNKTTLYTTVIQRKKDDRIGQVLKHKKKFNHLKVSRGIIQYFYMKLKLKLIIICFSLCILLHNTV